MTLQSRRQPDTSLAATCSLHLSSGPHLRLAAGAIMTVVHLSLDGDEANAWRDAALVAVSLLGVPRDSRGICVTVTVCASSGRDAEGRGAAVLRVGGARGLGAKERRLLSFCGVLHDFLAAGAPSEGETGELCLPRLYALKNDV